MNSKEKNRVIDPLQFDLLTSFEQKAKFLLAYAIQAPSTHNSQPWKFKIAEDSILIFKDTNYALPCADPTGRDLHISVGCAAENIVIAAQYFGIFSHVKMKPELHSTDALIEVVLKHTEGVRRTNLARLVTRIPEWSNDRGKYSGVVDEEILMKITTMLKKDSYTDADIDITFLKDKKTIESIANLTESGVSQAHGEKAFRKEMSHWMHSSITTKKTGMPGYSLRMPFIMSFLIPTFVKIINMGPLLAKVSKMAVSSAPLVAIIYSEKSDDELTWLRTGRLAQRVMLELQSRGFNTSIFVAAIELESLRGKLGSLLGKKSCFPQFLFITGIVDELHPLTPRLSVEEKLIS